MKITLHVDEALLDTVMGATGMNNKTKAIDLALREFARRAELKRLANEGLGLSAVELREAFDPASTSDEEDPGLKVYGSKPRSRR